MKYFVIFAALCLLAYSEAEHVTCKFVTKSLTPIGDIYACDVQDTFWIISREDAIIESFKPATNEVVKGYFARFETSYFPRNLENLFPGLEAIDMTKSQLKVILQKDLKPFNKLRYLDLTGSNIKVLRDGLFAFNPDLEFISFKENQMYKVQSNVFENLNKLSHLWFRNNNCIHADASDREAVKALINEIKTECPAYLLRDYADYY